MYLAGRTPSADVSAATPTVLVVCPQQTHPEPPSALERCGLAKLAFLGTK
jgi:hypothetical protein